LSSIESVKSGEPVEIIIAVQAGCCSIDEVGGIIHIVFGEFGLPSVWPDWGGWSRENKDKKGTKDNCLHEMIFDRYSNIIICILFQNSDKIYQK